MAKRLCDCGESIRSSGQMPNPLEWLLVPDTTYDSFGGPVDPEQIYLAMRHAFRCPSCDRLYVFWDGMAGDPIVYQPDTSASQRHRQA